MADDRAAVNGYAEGIFTVAKAEGVVDRVEDELYRVARTVEGNPELGRRLTDPAVASSTKLDVVSDLLSGRAHPQTVSALMYIVQSGRARLLPEIADAVVALASAERQRSVAEVRVATPLDEARTRRLATALSQATGREVDIKVIVDPEVVGGVVVRMGDTVIDGTIARRLTELRAQLTGA